MPASSSSEIVNWSGSVRFRPATIARPRDEEEVATVVSRANREGRRVRAVGRLHSSTGILETDDVLITVEAMRGVRNANPDAAEATVLPGTKVGEAGRELLEHGLSIHNQGDIDEQTLVGAISTGTHGSGVALPNLAAALIGGRLVTAPGEVLVFDEATHPDLTRSVRVGLGTIGVLVAARLRLQPAYRLRRSEWCAPLSDALEHLEELIEGNRNFDFYWYPRSDEVKLRILNPAEEEPRVLPYARRVREEEGWATEVLSRKRVLKFDEMEYVLPREQGLECFLAVRERVLARHRASVGWRVLYRTVAADDAFLSPMHGRDSVCISLHHNAGLPYEGYFRDIEPLFLERDGRPHWAKKHWLAAPDLAPRYPCWERWRATRRRYDPGGTFLNPYLGHLLGEDT